MRRVLIVAFNFPPDQGSSGVHRVLSTCRYLPDHGWKVSVLTVAPGAYAQVSAENLDMVPEGTRVLRAWGRDAQKSFAVLGRYPDVLSVPDRWQSWIPFALVKGMRELRRRRYDAVLATYPILSALVIGQKLSEWSGVPFVADFRDPVLGAGYTLPSAQVRMRERIEAAVMRSARVAFVTSQHFATTLAARYPEVSVRTVRNGYDEAMFERPVQRHSGDAVCFRLVHMGALYAEGRNPRPVLEALASLKSSGAVTPGSFRLEFYNTGNDALVCDMAREYGLESMIDLRPAVSYTKAIDVMRGADALLLVQGQGFHHQVPAKLYEYLAAGRPVFAVVAACGATAIECADAGLPTFELEGAVADIAIGLRKLVDGGDAGHFTCAPDVVPNYSRRHSVGRMAAALDGLV